MEAAVIADITSGRCLPATRETFTRLMRLTDDASFQRVTVVDWQTSMRTQPRPPSREPAARVGVTSNAARPDAELVERIEMVRKYNPGMDYFSAQMRVLRSDSDLAERYRAMPGTQ